MLPDATLQVPASLMTLLTGFAPLFTAPSFRTFTMLACGFVAQTGKPDGVRDADRCGSFPVVEP